MNKAMNTKEQGISRTEQNKKLLQSATEKIWNKGNFRHLDDNVTEDFVIHFSRQGENIHGPENVKEFYK